MLREDTGVEDGHDDGVRARGGLPSVGQVDLLVVPLAIVERVVRSELGSADVVRLRPSDCRVGLEALHRLERGRVERMRVGCGRVDFRLVRPVIAFRRSDRLAKLEHIDIRGKRLPEQRPVRRREGVSLLRRRGRSRRALHEDLTRNKIRRRGGDGERRCRSGVRDELQRGDAQDVRARACKGSDGDDELARRGDVDCLRLDEPLGEVEKVSLCIEHREIEVVDDLDRRIALGVKREQIIGADDERDTHWRGRRHAVEVLRLNPCPWQLETRIIVGSRAGDPRCLRDVLRCIGIVVRLRFEHVVRRDDHAS